MDDLLTIQDDNIGGLQTLRFAPLWFFESLSPITFFNGYDWIIVECTSESMQLDEEPVDDAHGGHVVVSISGDLPKQRPEVNEILEKYRFQLCLVDMTDQNGYRRLAGRYGGMRLFDPSNTGRQATDPNEYKIQFKGTHLQKAEFITE